MDSRGHTNLVPFLLGGLNQQLLAVLFGGFRFTLVAGSGMTVQVFLASLYRSFPAEVAPFLSEIEPLQKLVEQLSSIDISAHEITPAANPGDPAKMLMSKIDERLVDILSQTVKAATENGTSRADVGDFMRVLSNDLVSVAELRNGLGLTFKSHPT